MKDPKKLDKNKEKKAQYVLYLESVPKHKFACMAIGITDQTSINWRKEDPEFLRQCEAAISKFVDKNLKKAKPEFQLERLLREDFGQSIDHTTKGEKIESNSIVFVDFKNETES